MVLDSSSKENARQREGRPRHKRLGTPLVGRLSVSPPRGSEGRVADVWRNMLATPRRTSNTAGATLRDQPWYLPTWLIPRAR